jgi:hypothetical protein
MKQSKKSFQFIWIAPEQYLQALSCRTRARSTRGVPCGDPVTQLSNKLAMLTLVRTIHTRHCISEAKIVVDVLHLPEPLLIQVGPRFNVQPLGQAMVNIVSRSTKAWLAQYSACNRLQLFCVSPIFQPPGNCNSSDEYKNEITFK